MKGPNLTPQELATRWNLSEQTLAKWRWAGKGPDFIDFGGRVQYRVLDIEAYELQCLRRHTTTYDPKKKH